MACRTMTDEVAPRWVSKLRLRRRFDKSTWLESVADEVRSTNVWPVIQDRSINNGDVTVEIDGVVERKPWTVIHCAGGTLPLQ